MICFLANRFDELGAKVLRLERLSEFGMQEEWLVVLCICLDLGRGEETEVDDH